jgi:hypothetical protein
MHTSFVCCASPETELLVCCARTRLQPEIAARIREKTSASLDWDYLLAQANAHSIAPLVDRNLRAATGENVPLKVAAAMQAAVRANAMRCLAHTSELIRLTRLLESRGIRLLPYKGPVIAAQAYGDVSARQFEDLDLVLLQSDMPAADEAVRSLGYEPRFPWIHSPEGRRILPGEYSYFNAARQTILELHTEATLRHFPVRPHLNEFFARAVEVELGGQSVRTFRVEDALPFYCIHGMKDFWGKLVWVVDIAELLRAFPRLDWDAVLRASEQLRGDRMLYVGLALARGLFGAALPPEVSARVTRDRGAVALAADVASHLLGRDTSGRTARERFEFRRKSVRGFAAGWRYAMRLTLAPAEEDWQGAQQTHPASPFHALVRPFRLLRKYGAAGKQ